WLDRHDYQGRCATSKGHWQNAPTSSKEPNETGNEAQPEHAASSPVPAGLQIDGHIAFYGLFLYTYYYRRVFLNKYTKYIREIMLTKLMSVAGNRNAIPFAIFIN